MEENKPVGLGGCLAGCGRNQGGAAVSKKIQRGGLAAPLLEMDLGFVFVFFFVSKMPPPFV